VDLRFEDFLEQVKADIGVKPVAEAGRHVQLCSDQSSDAESGSYAGLDAASDMVMDDIGRERMSDFGRQVQFCSERTSDAESGSDAGLMDHVVDALMDVIWQCLQHEGNDNRSCLEIMKRVRDMMPEHEDMVAQLSEAWKTDTVEEFEFLKDSMAMYFVNEAKDQSG